MNEDQIDIYGDEIVSYETGFNLPINLEDEYFSNQIDQLGSADGSIVG